MKAQRDSAEHLESRTVCGFDKNHFSKPVLLSYSRGYIGYRDLIAVHQIEDSIISIESSGLKSSNYSLNKISDVKGKRLPDIYSQTMTYKFNHWVEILTKDKIVVGAILDILIDGKSFVSVDRRFKRANGWARNNMVCGLHLWNINHI